MAEADPSHHGHSHLPRFRFGRQPRLFVMLILTVGLFVAEITVGYMTSSLALIADSFHMLSDVLALGVALYAIKLAKRKGSTKSNSFGWQRAEILGALVNGVFLLALCFTIIIEAIQRFFEIQGTNVFRVQFPALAAAALAAAALAALAAVAAAAGVGGGATWL